MKGVLTILLPESKHKQKQSLRQLLNQRRRSIMNSTYKVVIAIFLAVVVVAEGQSPVVPSCVNNISPCIDFLNSTNRPPPSCCDPLREAVTNQLDCLCNLYSNQELLNTFNINLAQALRLPSSCGIPNDLSACNNTAFAPGSSAMPPSDNNNNRNNNNRNNNDGNGVGKIASTGLSSLLVILGASFILR